MSKKILLKYVFIMFSLIILNTHADKIRDLITIQGTRDNQLIGYGLIAGLNGTGDDTTNIPYTINTLKNMLAQLGIEFSSEKNIQLKNIAAVMVTAKYPSFIHKGQKIDVFVSSIGNAKSLKGGILLMTPLRSINNQIYAIAQGSITVNEQHYPQNLILSNSDNQYNSGKIIDGAIVEKEMSVNFGNKKIVILQLNNEDFALVQKISDKINNQYPNSSIALNSRTIQLYTPKNNTSQVRMLSNIQNIEIDLPVQDAKVIINTKTGDIVMNREVKINSCAVAHGNISMIINDAKHHRRHFEPVIYESSNHLKEINNRSDYYNENEVKYINQAVNLNNIVHALNSLGIKPVELISILQAMHDVGCLRAKIEVI
ncbi:MAG: flagellar basal body P-ring protein FlgI [Buchnera aphidicola (Nurudea ibofushi)]